MICIPVSGLKGAINVLCQNGLSLHQDCEGTVRGASEKWGQLVSTKRLEIQSDNWQDTSQTLASFSLEKNAIIIPVWAHIVVRASLSMKFFTLYE